MATTAAEFFAWVADSGSDDRRYELDSGDVVEIPLSGELHGFVCWRVVAALTGYTVARSGYLLTNHSPLVVGRNPDTVRGPDIMLMLGDEVPRLVVEVFDSSDRPGEYTRRVEQYHARGVPLVWVVYPEERAVSVCRPNEFPKVLDETDDLTGNGVLPEFACKVRDLFTSPGASPPSS